KTISTPLSIIVFQVRRTSSSSPGRRGVSTVTASPRARSATADPATTAGGPPSRGCMPSMTSKICISVDRADPDAAFRHRLLECRDVGNRLAAETGGIVDPLPVPVDGLLDEHLEMPTWFPIKESRGLVAIERKQCSFLGMRTL